MAVKKGRNIFILRSANTGDEDIKTGYADVELEQGFAVGLGEVSTDRKHRGAYKLAAPKAGDLVGLVYNATTPFLKDERGNIYKTEVTDPRNIYFIEGTNVDVWMPGSNSEIALTNVEGTEEGAKYVVYKADSMKPQYATDTTGALLAFKITGKSFISVGADRVPSVEAIKVPVE